MSDTITKFDENFFKMAEQKKQELCQSADRAAPIAEVEKQEIRKLVNEFAAPLEAKAFEAGRRAGLAEVDDKKATDPRERQVMARKMAEEAKEFVATEEKAGRTVTMAEAVKHVYEKAGVPTR